MTKLDDLLSPDYREPFICPYHNCLTDGGWCWECAVETYGYDPVRTKPKSRETGSGTVASMTPLESLNKELHKRQNGTKQGRCEKPGEKMPSWGLRQA